MPRRTANESSDALFADRVAFEARGGPRIQPGGAAYVRGNLAGIGTDDVVEQMTIAPDRTTEWDGTWQGVRDDSVIAAVKFRCGQLDCLWGAFIRFTLVRRAFWTRLRSRARPVRGS